jgi:hypothetical protein
VANAIGARVVSVGAGDLCRPLQQVLFDAADGLTG